MYLNILLNLFKVHNKDTVDTGKNIVIFCRSVFIVDFDIQHNI